MTFRKIKRVRVLEFLVYFYGLLFLAESAQFLFGETEFWSLTDPIPGHFTHSPTPQANNQSVETLYIVDQSQLYNYNNILSICDQLDDVIAAVSLSPCLPETDLLAVFSEHVGLPVLSVRQYCELNQTQTTASQGRHSGDLSVPWTVDWADPSTVIASAVVQEGWEEVIIIVDTQTDGLPVVDRLVSHLGDLGLLYSLFVVETEEHITQLMTNMSRWRPPPRAVPYLLLCDMNSTQHILTKAEQVGMARLEYFWFVYNQGVVEDLYGVLRPSDNVAFLATNRAGLAAWRRVLQEAVGGVMRQIEGVVEGYRRVHGSVHTDWSDGTCTHSLKQDVITEIHKTISLSTHLNINYTNIDPLYTIHSSVTRETGRPKMDEVATWWPDNTLDLADTLYPNSFFNGFNKRVFHVASLEYSFFQQKVVDENGTVTWRGLTFQLLDELAKDLNFTYVVEEPTDLQWGIEDEKGNWTGMMGMVVQKKVDFAAACFSITAARQQVADFPSPYYHDQSVVVMKRPGEKNRMLLYIYPFHWEVWAGTLGAIFLCGPVLWMLTRASPYYHTNHHPWGSYRGLFRLDNAILYIFGAFFQQGGIWLPNSQSGRVLVGCFWFFVIAVVAIYTGNLIAFLAVSTVEMPFDTLHGLVRQSAFQFGTSDGVALVMLFRDANFEPYTSVYSKMVTVPNYKEGLQRVKQGDYAFISEKSWYHSVSAVDAECEIAMMKEEFYPTSYGWALQPGSSFLEIFSDKINKIRESGLLEKWIQDWTPNNTHCKGLGPVTQTKVATVTDFQGALILLGIGVAIGLFLLLVEIGYFHMIANLRRNKKANVNGTSYEQTNGVVTECNGVIIESNGVTMMNNSVTMGNNGVTMGNNGVTMGINGVTMGNNGVTMGNNGVTMGNNCVSMENNGVTMGINGVSMQCNRQPANGHNHSGNHHKHSSYLETVFHNIEV